MFNWLIIIGAKYLIFLQAILAAVFWFAYDRSVKARISVAGAITFVVIILMGFAAGEVYYNPRPFVTGGFTPLVEHTANNGFPSTHTLVGAALAVIVFVFNKKIGVAMFGIAVLIGISRVLAGVHNWLDIFMSLLLAILGGLLGHWLIRFLPSIRGLSSNKPI